jgi:hypothetical protein
MKHLLLTAIAAVVLVGVKQKKNTRQRPQGNAELLF